LEGGPQGFYSPSTNVDFAAVRDVYRRWCLNEAGDYSDPPYNGGEPFDCTRIFGRAEYVQRRRRFENALTIHNGQSIGRHLEVSYDNGATWQAYGESFDVLDDECGVWLSSDQLPAELWSVVAAGTLKFRITAAVQSDTRLTAIIADGPVNSIADVVDHIICADEFQYKKVCPPAFSIKRPRPRNAMMRKPCTRMCGKLATRTAPHSRASTSKRPSWRSSICRATVSPAARTAATSSGFAVIRKARSQSNGPPSITTSNPQSCASCEQGGDHDRKNANKGLASESPGKPVRAY